ncbi:MAG: RES domain-containing protein [Thermodesulfobacteriota bacterium]
MEEYILLSGKHLLTGITIDSIKSRIQEIETLNRENVTIEDLKAKIGLLIKGYSCTTRIIDSDFAYRARKNPKNKHFCHVRELWYPPSDRIMIPSRLNRVGRSIFYISASEATAILEMRPRIGEIMTILRCRLINSDVKPHVMELGCAEKFSQHKIPTTLNVLENTTYGRKFLSNQENIEKNLLIRSFLTREFTRVVKRGNEFEFKVTVAIGEILMSDSRIDGVVYPSIAGDVDNWKADSNMALKPESADRLYMPDICWIVEVEKELGTFLNKSYLIHCIKKAQSITQDGKINW